MESPLLKHHPLRLWELDDTQFEYICRDVLEKAPEIRRAEKFGHNGQTQWGVDILARRKDGKLSLGSCKNYRAFSRDNLEDAIEEFWQHRARWKRRDAVAFILYIGCSKEDTKLQEQLLSYFQDFELEGLHLELWDNRDITDALREHQDIGRKHLDERIQADLYGSSADPGVSSPSRSSGNLAIAGGLQESIALEFNAEVEREIPSVRKMARMGRWNCALVEVEQRIASPRWAVLDHTIRSKVLILSAGLHIDAKNDLVGARNRIRLAREADPLGNFQVVESVIALREDRYEDALKILEIPESTDAWNIRISILINLGKNDEALEIIKQPPFTPNAGTYRVGSLASVVKGDFTMARDFVAKAIKDTPDGFHVRLLAASLQYLEAILPSFKDVRFLDWPIPPGWEYVLSDETALRSLRESEATFSELIKTLDADNETMMCLEGWRLGALANQPDRQIDASQYASELLARDPCHIPALVWALDRGFPFDRKASEKALSTAIVGTANIAKIQTLCSLLIGSGELHTAADLLDRSKALYVQPNEMEIWRHLRTQLAVGLEDDLTTEKLITEETDPTKAAILAYTAARIVAAKNCNSHEFIVAATKAFEQTGDPHCLFEACEVALLSGDTQFAEKHASELLSALPSSASLLVAAHACLAAGQYRRAIALLETNANLIPSGRMGERFKRIELDCRYKQGDLPNALKLAESHSQANSGVDAQMLLFSIQAQGADTPGSLRTARSLIERPDIPATALLMVAKEIHLSNPELASIALEKAIDKGLPDESMPDLIPIGFRLGLDKKVGPFLGRLAAKAQEEGSSVKMLSFEEIRELHRNHQARIEEFFAVYNRGEIPIHFGDSFLGYEVFRILLAEPDNDGKSNHHGQLPVRLIRSGIHATHKYALAKGRLSLDFTALLLAAQLEILESVEAEFAPILISSHTQALLRHIAEAISSVQPTIREACKQVISLIEEGLIGVRAETPSPSVSIHQPEEGGQAEDEIDLGTNRSWSCILTEQLPSIGADSSPVDREIIGTVLADEIIRVYHLGRFQQPNKTLNANEGICSDSEQPLPTFGASVFLGDGVARKLADKGILQGLATVFRLSISSFEYATLKNTLKEAARADAQANKIMALVEHIQRKQLAGIYRYITKAAEMPKSSGEVTGEATLALYDLHLAGDQGADHIWCDDRFVNAFEGFENSKIIGVSEILDALREKHRITRSDYFRSISNLRNSNYRYLPLTTEEILWCLADSTFSPIGVAEGSDLAILRRHVASCVLAVESMRKPDAATSSMMEFRWIFDMFKAINGAIREIWSNKESTDPEQRQISDYLLSEFFVPLLIVFELIGKEAPAAEKIAGIASAIASLMTEGFGFGWPEGVNPSLLEHPRVRFYKWIADRILTTFAEVEPDLVTELAKTEMGALLSLFETEENHEKHGMDALRTSIIRMIHDLPDVLMREVNLPEASRKQLGIGKPYFQASIAGITFVARDIWRAASKAARSGSATAKGVKRDERIAFSHLGKWPPAKKLFIKGSGCPRGGKFSHPALPVAALDEAGIQRFLARRVDWFDLPNGQRFEKIRKIARERDPAKRIQHLFDLQAESLEWHYKTIASRYRSRQDLTAEDLIPSSLHSFANHLRLTPEELTTGCFDLEICASRLIADVGLARTVQRFVHLPVPMPLAIIRAFESAPEKELSFVFSRMERIIKHPLALIQVGGLLASVLPKKPKWAERITRLVEVAIGSAEGRDAWMFFGKVLDWTFTVFGAHARFRDIPVRSRLLLSWLHAGRLADVFLTGELLIKENGDVFVSHGRAYGLEIGAWHANLWNDCAHPRFAQRVPVLMAALGSAITRLPGDVCALLKRDTIYGLNANEDSDNSAVFLLRDTSLMSNSLDSFLGGDSRSTFRDAMTPGFIQRYKADDPRDFLSQCLEKLEQDVKDKQTWNVLGIILGDLPVPKTVESKLRGLISSDEFAELVASDLGDAATLLRFAVSRCSYHADQEFISLLECLINRRVRINAAKCDGDSLRFDVAHIASCYMCLAVVAGNAHATYTRFFKALANMMIVWPASSAIFGSSNWCWPNKWPLSRQSGYWRFELTRRAVGHPESCSKVTRINYSTEREKP